MKFNAFLALVVGLALPSSLFGAPVYYSDEALFSLNSNTDTVDFEGSSFTGLTTGTNIWTSNSSSGFSIDDATFTATPSAYQAIIGSGFSDDLYDRGTGNVYHAARGSSSTITFSREITAFSLDLSTIFRVNGTVNVSFSNGETAVATLGDPLQFNGFISDNPFTSVTISNPTSSAYLLYDNVRYGLGSMAAVPLPATGWMLIAGIGGLAAAKRRRRPSSTT